MIRKDAFTFGFNAALGAALLAILLFIGGKFLTAIFAVVWFLWREQIGRIGFYLLFALVVTASVQMVGVYLVFTSLIVPAVATSRKLPVESKMRCDWLISEGLVRVPRTSNAPAPTLTTVVE